MISPFISWCTSQGIISPLTLCGENSSYRYMSYEGGAGSNNNNFSITSSPTITGTILQVPLKACIIANSPEKLSEKLLQERNLGQESFYAPYIDILPQLYDTDDNNKSQQLQSLPRFWDEDKIELISNYDCGQLERRLQQDKRDETFIDPWAFGCVSSRANYVLGHGYAMTPMLDMINHDNSVSTSAKIISAAAVVGDDNGMGPILELSIKETYSLGDEVFISYGDLTNLDTLCNYGFVSASKNSNENKCNKEMFDVLLMRKPPIQVTISSLDGSIDEVSIATLRSYLASPTELERATTDYNYFNNPISETNEDEVYSLIVSFLDEAIYNVNEGVEKFQGKDELIERYLQHRGDTLKKGLMEIKKKFPNLEF